MAPFLSLHDRQHGGHAIQETYNIHVDHVVPLFDFERSYWRNRRSGVDDVCGSPRRVSASWRPSMRVALYTITLVTAAGSSLAYAYFALGAARPATAAFVLIPPTSLLFAALALGTTAYSARE